jgi:hypothetical protein
MWARAEYFSVRFGFETTLYIYCCSGRGRGILRRVAFSLHPRLDKLLCGGIPN